MSKPGGVLSKNIHLKCDPSCQGYNPKETKETDSLDQHLPQHNPERSDCTVENVERNQSDPSQKTGQTVATVANIH